ncbi:MAG: hypothetical protein EOO41_03485, partial [Methanobacteriota archaeon]
MLPSIPCHWLPASLDAQHSEAAALLRQQVRAEVGQSENGLAINIDDVTVVPKAHGFGVEITLTERLLKIARWMSKRHRYLAAYKAALVQTVREHTYEQAISAWNAQQMQMQGSGGGTLYEHAHSGMGEGSTAVQPVPMPHTGAHYGHRIAPGVGLVSVSSLANGMSMNATLSNRGGTHAHDAGALTYDAAEALRATASSQATSRASISSSAGAPGTAVANVKRVSQRILRSIPFASANSASILPRIASGDARVRMKGRYFRKGLLLEMVCLGMPYQHVPTVAKYMTARNAAPGTSTAAGEALLPFVARYSKTLRRVQTSGSQYNDHTPVSLSPSVIHTALHVAQQLIAMYPSVVGTTAGTPDPSSAALGGMNAASLAADIVEGSRAAHAPVGSSGAAPISGKKGKRSSAPVLLQGSAGAAGMQSSSDAAASAAAAAAAAAVSAAAAAAAAGGSRAYGALPGSMQYKSPALAAAAAAAAAASVA